AVNSEFNYPYYFSMFPAGPDAVREFSRGYFEIAKEQKLQTVAIAGADSDFAKKAADGARENATKLGFKIVYDRGYPPNAVEFTPIVRGIQASNPDFVYIASYPTRDRRHRARGKRGRSQDQVVRWRHGRPAIRRHQDPARRVAQQDRRLRLLRPRTHGAVHGDRKLPRALPGQGAVDRR